jgi:hypothetical protein
VLAWRSLADRRRSRPPVPFPLAPRWLGNATRGNKKPPSLSRNRRSSSANRTRPLGQSSSSSSLMSSSSTHFLLRAVLVQQGEFAIAPSRLRVLADDVGSLAAHRQTSACTRPRRISHRRDRHELAFQRVTFSSFTHYKEKVSSRRWLVSRRRGELVECGSNTACSPMPTRRGGKPFTARW